MSKFRVGDEVQFRYYNSVDGTWSKETNKGTIIFIGEWPGETMYEVEYHIPLLGDKLHTSKVMLHRKEILRRI